MSVAFFQLITITIVAAVILLLDVKIAAAFTNISTTHRRRQQFKIIMSSHQTTDANASSSSSPRAAIDFLTLTRSLKTTKRTGWVMSGVPNPESIADHMYRMSLMAMIASFSNESLDTNRCIKLALIHDLAEAKVGDITPHCGVSDEEKYKLELGTMEQIQSMLGPLLGGDEILDLWKEYEEGSTTEAKLLKDLDKIEMILQAQEYEAEGSSEKSLDQFFTSTEGKWRTEIGRAWAEEIVSRRKKSEKK